MLYISVNQIFTPDTKNNMAEKHPDATLILKLV